MVTEPCSGYPVQPAHSAVTVYCVAACALVGTPLISPVDQESSSPISCRLGDTLKTQPHGLSHVPPGLGVDHTAPALLHADSSPLGGGAAGMMADSVGKFTLVIGVPV